MTGPTTPGGGALPGLPTAVAGTRLPRYLRCHEAAELLRVSTQTLRNWRSAGTGPRTVKVGGRVLWPSDDVLHFAEHGEQASA